MSASRPISRQRVPETAWTGSRAAAAPLASLSSEAAIALAAAVRHAGLGVMALGSAGRLLHANEVARSCLEPEGPLRLRQGRLVAADAAGQCVVEALARLEQTGQPQFFALQRPGRLPAGTGATAQVFAVTACIEEIGSVRQRVLILEPLGERGPLDETALSHWLGLTGAQARVAAALSRGLSPEEAARHCGRSIATIRTHIRGILERTNLESLQQLYRALAGLGRGWSAASR